MTPLAAAAAGTFGVGHIAVTAAITAALALAAVLLWQWSANTPQLDDDGLPGFSADDRLAPALTYVVLAVHTDLRGPTELRRFDLTEVVKAGRHGRWAPPAALAIRLSWSTAVLTRRGQPPRRGQT